MPCMGKETRIGYFTPAFLGVQIWARWLRNAAFLGVPSVYHGDKIRKGPNRGKMAA